MFIPIRKEEIKIATQPKISDSGKKKINRAFTSDEKNKIRDICTMNFQKTFDIKGNDKEKIKLAQLERFFQELQKRKYSFKSNEIKEFVEKQIKREVAKNFYKEFKKQFIDNQEYSFEILEQSGEIDINTLNRKIIDMIKLQMRAELGRERVEKLNQGEI